MKFYLSSILIVLLFVYAANAKGMNICCILLLYALSAFKCFKIEIKARTVKGYAKHHCK